MNRVNAAFFGKDDVRWHSLWAGLTTLHCNICYDWWKTTYPNAIKPGCMFEVHFHFSKTLIGKKNDSVKPAFLESNQLWAFDLGFKWQSGWKRG